MAKPKNIGDQIRDAIENAVQARDYSGLRSSIEDSLDMAAGLVAQGLHQAAQAAQSMQEKSAQQKALQAQALQQEQERLRREQELALAKECYGSTTGKKFTGYAMIALGGAGVLASLVLLAVFAPLAFAGPVVAAFAAATVASAGFALASGVLCGLGARRISLVKRFQAYRGVLATRFMCPLEELAAQTGRTVKFVRKDVRKMIDAGLFKQGHLDDAQTQLMVTDAVYGQYRSSLDAAKQREQQRLAAQAQAPVALGAHLDGEARAMLQKGEAYIAQIRASNAAIPGAEISAKIDQIEAVVLSIFKRAEEHPEVIGDLDCLMDYYLPTTITLLDAYEDLDKQPVAGEAIAASKAEIEATLDTLSKAFARLLDSLFTDMAWDVSSDVSVLHTVLAQEGLLEDPFAAKRDSTRSL